MGTGRLIWPGSSDSGEGEDSGTGEGWDSLVSPFLASPESDAVSPLITDDPSVELPAGTDDPSVEMPAGAKWTVSQAVIISRTGPIKIFRAAGVIFYVSDRRPRFSMET